MGLRNGENVTRISFWYSNGIRPLASRSSECALSGFFFIAGVPHDWGLYSGIFFVSQTYASIVEIINPPPDRWDKN